MLGNTNILLRLSQHILSLFFVPDKELQATRALNTKLFATHKCW